MRRVHVVITRPDGRVQNVRAKGGDITTVCGRKIVKLESGNFLILPPEWVKVYRV